MKGVILAAGLGTRLGEFSKIRPKCLLPVGGRRLIDYTVENMRNAGCEEVVIVTGHLAECIDTPNVTKVFNADYRDNNQLHSLMTARDYLQGPALCSFSDIYVEPRIFETVMETSGDIVLGIDRDWMGYYEGRTEHPIEQADTVHFDSTGQLQKIGKRLPPESADGLNCGEFIGLWRFTEKGARVFNRQFDGIDARLSPTDPFHEAPEWRKAYINDIVQDLIDHGQPVDCAVIERGWAEFDTMQDHRRLPSIIELQGLDSLAMTVDKNRN